MNSLSSARHRSLRPALRQLPVAFVALLSCGLSGWLTFRFCAQLCPHEGLIELVAMGIIWEASKLLLGTYGMHTIAWGNPFERCKSAALVAISLLLAAGSVAASLGFLVQSDAKQQTAALAASKPYQHAEESLIELKKAIEQKTSLAEKMGAINHLSESKRVGQEADALRTQRDDLEKKLAGQDLHPAVAGGSDFFVNMAAAVPALGVKANHLRLGAQCVLAVMLEAIGMIMLSMLRASFLFENAAAPAAPPSNSDGPSPLKLVHSEKRTIQLRPRTGTSTARTQTGTPRGHSGRGDTGIGTQWASRYNEVKNLIATGDLDPTYRAIRGKAKCGHETAKRFLAAMLGEDVLRREGKRYVYPWGAAA